jgi:hypothetical protein
MTLVQPGVKKDQCEESENTGGADAVEVPNSVFSNESWIETAQLRAC